MSDPGDEHVDASPVPVDPISALLAEWEAEDIAAGRSSNICASRALFDFIGQAECMRYCCAACALEANGEDGS